MLAENGVSVDLVGGAGVDRRRGAGRQDVRRRVDHRRRRRRHVGRTAHPVIGFHRGDGGGATRHRDAGGARRTCIRAASPKIPRRWSPPSRKVEAELESLAAENVTDPTRIAQAVRRTVGKWVGETYRRQPMIVPTVIEI